MSPLNSEDKGMPSGMHNTVHAGHAAWARGGLASARTAGALPNFAPPGTIFERFSNDFTNNFTDESLSRILRNAFDRALTFLSFLFFQAMRAVPALP